MGSWTGLIWLRIRKLSVSAKYDECFALGGGLSASLEGLCHVVSDKKKTLKVQGDSKRLAQFRTSILPELYMVCELST